MKINKDTKIFGSFAKKAGNNGCNMFNPAFEAHGINAIYRSFSVDNIEDAIKSAKVLGFSGFAVTMPFKKEAVKYMDTISSGVFETKALNTVIIEDGKLHGYNTDFIAAQTMLARYDKSKDLYILGNGGYSAAVQYAAKTQNWNFHIITRSNWNKIEHIKNSIIYNCTPAENFIFHESNDFISCLITLDTGYELSKIQAEEQFFLYTGKRVKL